MAGLGPRLSGRRLFPPPLWGRVREGGRAALESIVLQARPQFDQLQSNGFQRPVDVVENLVIRKSQNVVALRSQCGGARRIARAFRVGRMRGAVDFDDEPRLIASEVDDEATENDLTPKPEASDLFTPDAIPETALGAGRACPELARDRL